MAEILDWRRAGNPQPIIQFAARALAKGRLVAFPTETVYGIAASALVPEAVERLVQCKSRPDNKPMALAIRGAGEALDWVPQMREVGRRLARRCWPGPVTLVCGDGLEQGVAGRLPESVRRRVCPAGTLGLRTPDHEAFFHVLRQISGPLVLTSANSGGEPDPVTPEEVLQSVGERVDLLIADGPSRYRQASTVVQVTGNTWSILREGVVPAGTLARLTSCIIVFVCTGNTCRSPMAEALCRKLLADRLQCSPEELPARGFNVISAGLAAMTGGPAAPEAIEAIRELGGDLTNHLSRPLTRELTRQADFLIAMTGSHLHALAEHHNRLGNPPRLLNPDGHDIPDPIGSDQETYRACARQILGFVEQLLPEMEQP
jgi:tRNA threonylcarbamoyl adenosine modification protein (Sua5/YciO/YrdC/YwlC family)